MIKIEDDSSVLKQRNEELEQSIRNLKEERDYLVIRNEELEHSIRNLEEERDYLMIRNEELEQSIRNLKEKRDYLMIRNNILECEKNEAESETDIWKAKCKELEIELLKLKKRVLRSGSDSLEMYSGGGCKVAGGQSVLPSETEIKAAKDEDASGTRHVSTPAEQYEGFNRHLNSTVGKCLDFGATATHISISDDSDDGVKRKRRRVGRGAALVVSSESENNDNTPIGKLKSKDLLALSSDSSLKSKSADSSCFRNKPKKGRLRKVRDCEDTGDSKERSTKRKKAGEREDKGDSKECSSKSTGNQKKFGISENLNDNLVEDENEEDDSSNVGESLDSFIAPSSDASGTDSGSNYSAVSAHERISGDCSGESENVSSGIKTYKKVMSRIKREKKNKLKWDFEADMLADFAKCPELCMKAVCAIYRQQTAEEQSCKATIFCNGRGFSHAHSHSGSTLGEFLTDGDPKGDMNKSVEDLKEFDSKGVEQCRILANCYSKQLFEIYENKEDPFFHP